MSFMEYKKDTDADFELTEEELNSIHKNNSSYDGENFFGDTDDIISDDFDDDLDFDTDDSEDIDSNNEDELEYDTGDSENTDSNDEVDIKSLKSYVQESIVPDGITRIRIVALILDDAVIGYRIKTDKGYFDILAKKLATYGINGFKVEKAIKLNRVNGLILSSNEIKAKQCVPDISKNDEDCNKIINYIFSCGINN